MLEVYKSCKGQDKIYCNGYSYCVIKKNLRTINWRCDKHYCHGTLATDVDYNNPNSNYKELQKHNHLPDPEKEMEKIKMCEKSKHMNVSKDFNGLLEPVTEIISEDSFVISEKFCKVEHNGENVRFLLHDDGPDDLERIIIFASDTMLEFLESSSMWMCDSMFQLSPVLGYHLIIIIGVMNSLVYSCVYALIPNKSLNNYKRVIQIIKKFKPNIWPQKCLLDFDSTFHQAFREEYANTVVLQGSLFHLKRTIMDTVDELELTERYKKSTHFFEMISSLGLLQINSVQKAYELLEDYAYRQFDSELQQFINFFEDNFIGRLRANGIRQRPTYPLYVWNANNIDDKPWATLETIHKRIQCDLESSRGKIMDVINACIKQEVFSFSLLLSGTNEDDSVVLNTYQLNFNELSKFVESGTVETSLDGQRSSNGAKRIKLEY